MASLLLRVLTRARLAFYELLLAGVQRTSVRAAFERDALRNREVDPDGPDAATRLRFEAARALQQREVRSILYYRWSQGPAREQLLAKILERLLPGAPTLQIEHCRDLGPGLRLPHGFASVIWAERIGRDCTIRQQVTIGVRDLEERRHYPVLGDRVTVGAGAIVLGSITIGDDATIGAGAVVLHDVAPGVTVVGVPARPIGAHTPA